MPADRDTSGPRRPRCAASTGSAPAACAAAKAPQNARPAPVESTGSTRSVGTLTVPSAVAPTTHLALRGHHDDRAGPASRNRCAASARSVVPASATASTSLGRNTRRRSPECEEGGLVAGDVVLLQVEQDRGAPRGALSQPRPRASWDPRLIAETSTASTARRRRRRRPGTRTCRRRRPRRTAGPRRGSPSAAYVTRCADGGSGPRACRLDRDAGSGDGLEETVRAGPTVRCQHAHDGQHATRGEGREQRVAARAVVTVPSMTESSMVRLPMQRSEGSDTSAPVPAASRCSAASAASAARNCHRERYPSLHGDDGEQRAERFRHRGSSDDDASATALEGVPRRSWSRRTRGRRSAWPRSPCARPGAPTAPQARPPIGSSVFSEL